MTESFDPGQPASDYKEGSEEQLVCCAWGCVTPIGEDAKESALAFRAGASPLGLCGMLTSKGSPPFMSTVPLLDPYLEGDDRLLPLLKTALGQTVGNIATTITGRSLIVYYLADEDPPPPQEPTSSAEQLALFCREEVAALCGIRPQVEVDVAGAAGLASVLKHAQTKLLGGRVELALICAGHTDYSRQRLRQLEDGHRLRSAESLDGLVLGELAGAVLLTTPRVARNLQLRAALQIEAVATAFEKANLANEESAYEALAMTAVARRASSPLERRGQKLGWLSTDANLEQLRMAELQSLLVRLQRRMGPPQVIDTPIHRLGNMGAMTGIWQLIYAAEAWSRSFAPAPELLSLLGSDNGARSALLTKIAS